MPDREEAEQVGFFLKKDKLTLFHFIIFCKYACVSVCESVCRPRGLAACNVVAAVVDVVAVVVVVSCFLRSATTQFRLHFKVQERIFLAAYLGDVPALNGQQTGKSRVLFCR